jgi:DNA-binding response OmpR family regulator
MRLERIPMDLLLLLVREGCRLVGREEIIERLWGKNVRLDTDNSIKTAGYFFYR